MRDRHLLLAACAACAMFVATLSSSAHAGLPCTSNESCEEGEVCLGLDGGVEGGPSCGVQCFGAGHACDDSSECCDGMGCSGPLGQEGVPECGGNDLGGTDLPGTSDAGADHDAGAASSSSGGCSVSGLEGSSGGLWAVGLALAVVARRRRR